MKTEIRAEADRTGNMLEGFGAGIIDALEREQQRLKKNAEVEAAGIVAEAKQLAEDITSRAGERAAQEGAERTRQDVEQILAAAKEESARIIAGGRQDSLAQSNKILFEARQEADKVAGALTEEAKTAAAEVARSATELRSKAQQEAADATEKALLEAAQIVKEAVDAAKAGVAERQDRILTEAARESDTIVGQATTRANRTLQEAAAAVGQSAQELHDHVKEIRRQAAAHSTLQEAGQHLVQAPEQTQQSVPAFGTAATPTVQDSPVVRTDLIQYRPLSLAQVLDSDVLFDRTDNSVLYCGEVELNVVPPADVHQLGEFQDHLKTVPHLEIQRFDRTESADLKITVVATVAMPLFEIVRSLPMVEEAEQVGKDILITLLPPAKSRRKRVAGRSDCA